MTLESCDKVRVTKRYGVLNRFVAFFYRTRFIWQRCTVRQ